MIDILMLRHGVTEWNIEKRLQGQTDIPLSEQGRKALQAYRIPAQWHQRTWYCSPLLRARQTAEMLALDCQLEPALQEADWGEWVGYSRQQLIQHYGADAFYAMEQKGLDLLPPGGESPRQLQMRLNQWVMNLSSTFSALPIHSSNTQTQEQPSAALLGAVCHRGVLRALLALATDWDMLGPPPYELQYSPHYAHRFTWSLATGWMLADSNLPLEYVAADTDDLR